MRMPFSASERTPATAGLLCLILATSLAGCASKNPLMDDATTASTSKPAEPTSAPTMANAPEANAAPATNISDTHTTGPTGFGRFLGKFSPYRVDVQQGNFVTREMVDQLRESMQRPQGVTREQVRFVLGTPLLTDIFHSDRWDYVFRLQKRNGEVISSHVTAVFQNNRLTAIDGGNLPTEQEYLAYIAGSVPGSNAAPVKK